jgi:hypothetical protein
MRSGLKLYSVEASTGSDRSPPQAGALVRYGKASTLMRHLAHNFRHLTCLMRHHKYRTNAGTGTPRFQALKAVRTVQLSADETFRASEERPKIHKRKMIRNAEKAGISNIEYRSYVWVAISDVSLEISVHYA